MCCGPAHDPAQAAIINAVEQERVFDSITRLGVALSGGADSLALLDALETWRRRGGAEMRFVPIHVDQYRRRDDVQRLRDYISDQYGLPLHIAVVDSRAVARRLLSQGKAPCRGCAPMRADALAGAVDALELDAVALGHHLNDALATLLLNIFHSGATSTMRMVSHRRPSGVRIVRPFLFTPESVVKAASPVGQQGLFTCELCGTHASERLRMARFVAETFDLHGPSVTHAQEAVRQAGKVQLRRLPSRAERASKRRSLGRAS